MPNTKHRIIQIPDQCINCKNRDIEDDLGIETVKENSCDCLAFTEYIPDSTPCPAIQLWESDKLNMLCSMARYARKKTGVIPAGLQKELNESKKISQRISTLEARKEYYESLHKDGKKGGGGEKEKAPNKKTFPKPTIWRFDEL